MSPRRRHSRGKIRYTHAVVGPANALDSSVDVQSRAQNGTLARQSAMMDRDSLELQLVLLRIQKKKNSFPINKSEIKSVIQLSTH